MTPESKVLRDICRWLDEQAPDVWYTKVRGGAYSNRGLPDIIGGWKTYDCEWAKAFAFEVKGEKGKATLLQEHTLMLMRNAGWIAEVARSVEDVKSRLASLK